MWGIVVVTLSLAIWLYLLTGRGGCWLAAIQHEAAASPTPRKWPHLAVVVPARNEAESIGACVASLLTQDYPAPFQVVVVDDGSRDGTAKVAREAAGIVGTADRLTVVAGRPLPAGWSGKLWAIKQGLDHAQASPLVLLTDADIRYDPGVLRDLVARMQADHLVLSSLMVRLRCSTWIEAAFVPAFVFFFQMLYPFRWVNDRARDTAAAAGGCMLVRADALREADGIEAIRGALIDDCALARRLKRHGPIRLALTCRVESLRPYPDLSTFGAMVTRTAYTELNHSPVALAGVTAAMALTFLAGPLAAAFGSGWTQGFGAAGWALMAVAYQPMLGFYRRSPLWGVALPAIAFVFMLWTLDSALQHIRGKGGAWKGRIQAKTADQP
jgi:hopene-associated glycosyltransferase HpnB